VIENVDPVFPDLNNALSAHIKLMSSENLVKMERVKSSNIESVGYHHESQTLHVIFKTGGHFTYSKVHPVLFHNFMQAKSKGAFFHEFVKGKHESKKLE
jgi:hypothetical protein